MSHFIDSERHKQSIDARKDMSHLGKTATLHADDSENSLDMYFDDIQALRDSCMTNVTEIIFPFLYDIYNVVFYIYIISDWISPSLNKIYLTS